MTDDNATEGTDSPVRGDTVTCKLCEADIAPFKVELHALTLEDGTEVGICDRCADRLKDWMGERLARLFPTRAMKKAFGKKRR